MECKVSVIVPVYNVQPYIKRCIRSIQKQTLCEFECIIIDDASPDASIACIQPIIENDTRFRVIHHTRNKGLGPARNTGIENAVAEYICFVDSDDSIEPDYLKLLYNTAIEKNAYIVACANNYTKKKSHISVTNFSGSSNLHESIQNILMFKDAGSSCCRIYKKALFTAVKFPRGYYEDIGTIVRLIAENNITSIPSVSIPLYNYFQNANSITKTVTRRHIYDFFRNILLPIIHAIHNDFKILQDSLQIFIFIKLSIILLTIQKFSHNVPLEILFVNTLIKRYIPIEILQGNYLRVIFNKEIMKVYNRKKVIIYILIYISHLKCGLMNSVFAILFHKVLKFSITLFGI